MARSTTRFVCQNCGYSSPKWLGRCPECNEWNSLVEEAVRAAPSSLAASITRGTGPGSGQEGSRYSYMGAAQSGPRPITEIEAINHSRTSTLISEFDRVLGGGVVPGSLILIGGDPGIGKCLAGSERIFNPATGDLIPIAEWASGRDTVLALDSETLQLTPKRVAAFLDQGIKPIVEVRTRLGRTLRCTPNHPLRTAEGWKPVSELRIGEQIASPRSLPFFGSEMMPDSLVKLIAYILSDGSAGQQVTVTSMLPEVGAELKEIAASLGMTLRTYEKTNNRAIQYRFVIPCAERGQARQELASALHHLKQEKGIAWAEWARRADIPYDMLRTWRDGRAVPKESQLQQLAEAVSAPIENLAPVARQVGEKKSALFYQLEALGIRFLTARTKAVPAAIFRLPKEQLQTFLRVLFTCDGSLYVGRITGISYSTISRRLAEDVQHLLLRFGLVAKLRTKISQVNGAPYTAYELQMLGPNQANQFLKEIGIWGREEAKERLREMNDVVGHSTHFDTVPTGPAFWGKFKEVVGGLGRDDIRERSGVRIYHRRTERPLCRRTLAAFAAAFPDPYFEQLATSDIYWDEITEILPAGEERVYDLSIPGAANFVANDLIVHNSTLMSQVAGNVAREHGTTLYVSGEESAEQIKMRATRLGADHPNLLLASETDVAQVAAYVAQLQPKYVIIDSIQTMQSPDVDSSPGTVSQVRASTAALAAIAKGMKIPIFLVGHVTKEGAIAGPRVLEHMVDTVLYFEGDRHVTYRILRAVKNRFGSTDELGIFEMREEGLIGVENPSEVFLAERPAHGTGSTVTATIEGTRPLLVEIQALVAPSYLTSPRRMTNGVERDRVSLILAVLEKRVGLSLANQDVYVNVAGGVEVKEPAADLAIALAVASSFKEMPVDPEAIFLGEIGLSGEVRGCSQIEKRLKEAARLGFVWGMIPQRNIGRDSKGIGIAPLGVDSVRTAVEKALKG